MKAKDILLKLKYAFLRTFLSGRYLDLFYIYGCEVLPTPLDQESERNLLCLIETGDENAKKELIEHNIRLVVYIAKKFENTAIDKEDLISVGTIGLIKAVNSFKSDKNIKLATYASRCIENEILMHLRKTSRLKVEMSFDEPLNVDGDGNELLLSDILGSEPDIVCRDLENQVEVDLLYDAISRLNARERYIMKLRFGLFGTGEKTQKEVADLLGISQSYISRLEKKIIFKIKREMQKVI